MKNITELYYGDSAHQMRQTKLSLLVFIVLLLSGLVAFGFVMSAFANPNQSASPLLSMPIEHVNYTITRVNGTLWAKIDGTYPIYLSTVSSCASQQSLVMVYPTPPGTVNIRVLLNEIEMAWSNYTQTYPAALHHTAIGDWPMINCTIAPLSDFFMLKIHYEHPLASINGSYLFLYDLNIRPYLSPESPSSKAYFIISFEEDVRGLKVYTTKTDTEWNPINYTQSVENETEIVKVLIQSEYAQPLLGDLVVMFIESENATPPFSLWTILISVAVSLVLAWVFLSLFWWRRRKQA